MLHRYFNRIFFKKFFIHTKSCVPGWFSCLQDPIVHTIFQFHIRMSCWQLETGNSGSVYTVEIGNATNQSFLLPGSQFLKFINIPLLTYHSIEIILLRPPMTIKLPNPNMYFCLLFIWTQSYLIFWSLSFLLEILSLQLGSKALHSLDSPVTLLTTLSWSCDMFSYLSNLWTLYISRFNS